MGAMMQGPQAKPKASKSNVLGFTLYHGPSVLDPSRTIAAILTLKTSNRKTGNMAQVWIIDAGALDPVELSKAKLDSSICGNCPHKQSAGGACYVNIGQAPLAVYRAFKRGRYEPFVPSEHGSMLATRRTRLGAYGDPAAVPFAILEQITKLSLAHTGYTHQAAHAAFDSRYTQICMVSADTPAQAIKWQAKGAHTFRVALAGDSLAANEVECLADSKGLTCNECGLCDGSKGNVAITVHGSRSKRFKSKLIDLREVV